MNFNMSRFIAVATALFAAAETSAATSGVRADVPEPSLIFKDAGLEQAREASPLSLHGNATFDVLSGYEFRGALANDQPVYWSYGELDLVYRDLAALCVWGFQSTDMTCARKESLRRMNEWDAGASGRVNIPLSERVALGLDLGHCWCSIRGAHGPFADYYEKIRNSLYGFVWLETPYVIPYATAEYEYRVAKCGALTAGIRRKFMLPAGFEFTADISVGGGSKGYNAGLYPPYDAKIGSGIMFARVSCELLYRLTANIGIGATLSYSVLTDPTVRESINSVKDDPARKDFLCGGIGLRVDF